MALELQQGTETKVSITNSSKSEKRWIKVFNSLAEAEIGASSGSKGAIDLKKLKEYLGAKDTSSKKVCFLFFKTVLVKNSVLLDNKIILNQSQTCGLKTF